MAQSAVSAETQRNMIGICCGCVILIVARDTGDVESAPVSIGRIAMTVYTLNSLMNTTKRKPGHIVESGKIFHLRKCRGIMTAGTIESEFPVMYILMTLKTLLWSATEL